MSQREVLDPHFARRGRGGAALLMQGPAGIGKTCLLERVIEQAAARGFEVHRAHGDELEVGFPSS